MKDIDDDLLARQVRGDLQEHRDRPLQLHDPALTDNPPVTNPAKRTRPFDFQHHFHNQGHPDLIGTYLAACVTYAALYGRSPVGNPYDYYGKIDRETAAFLQQVAEDTVRSFYAR